MKAIEGDLVLMVGVALLILILSICGLLIGLGMILSFFGG
jgi:hypothetical protein